MKTYPFYLALVFLPLIFASSTFFSSDHPIKNDCTNQQNAITSFVFEHQDTTLIINAQTDRILYTAHFQPNPYVTYDSLKDSLNAR
jgi:hypothetical protein